MWLYALPIDRPQCNDKTLAIGGSLTLLRLGDDFTWGWVPLCQL